MEGFICFAPLMLFGMLATLFWLWMLVDCLMNEPSHGNDKLIWVIVILLTHFIGAAVYFIFRRPERNRDRQ